MSIPGPIGCRSCDLHDVCKFAGVLAFDVGRSRQSTGSLRTVQPGEALYRAGDPAHRLFAVRQGMLKSVHVDADGDEQIVALNIPGDVLGLEAFGSPSYACDVIALQPVVCCELPLQLAQEQGALLPLLGKAAAPKRNPARGPLRQRITNFLLDLGARFSSRGLDGREFALGLSRQELANLLDTRIETVSRIIQRLHREQAIRVRGNRVSLVSLANP